MKKKPSIWISQEEYDKAIGQFGLQLNEVFKPFKMYGLDVFISGAIDEVTQLAEDFGLRVRGVDKPLSLEAIRTREQVERNGAIR